MRRSICQLVIREAYRDPRAAPCGETCRPCSDLLERLRDARADGVDERLHELLPLGSVEPAVGGHEPLIELPRDLDRAMPFVGEQRVQSRALPFGEEAHPGVQGAAGAVERIALAATMAVDVLLHAPGGSG